MNEYTLTRGDVQEALSVMREAAQWLEDRAMPLWTREDILALPQAHPADAFLTLYHQGHPAAAALLTDADPLLWPQVVPGSSGFLHKLSVRRAYAGQGLAQRLIHLTGILCNNEGKTHLRLDCDASREKLIALYQSAGFTCLGVRTVQTRAYGTVRAALFERALA